MEDSKANEVHVHAASIFRNCLTIGYVCCIDAREITVIILHFFTVFGVYLTICRA